MHLHKWLLELPDKQDWNNVLVLMRISESQSKFWRPRLSTCLFVCLSICLPVYLSVCLFVYLVVYPKLRQNPLQGCPVFERKRSGNFWVNVFLFRWKELESIDATNTRMRYFAAAEARNNFIAAGQNIQSCRVYLGRVKFPYATEEEISDTQIRSCLSAVNR